MKIVINDVYDDTYYDIEIIEESKKVECCLEYYDLLDCITYFVQKYGYEQVKLCLGGKCGYVNNNIVRGLFK